MMLPNELKEERMILQDKIKYRKYQEYISCRLMELKVRNEIRKAMREFYDRKGEGLTI